MYDMLMHIKKASLETYLALKGSLKAPLIHVENENETATLDLLFQSYCEADKAFSDQSGVHYNPTKYANDMLPFETSVHKITEYGLKDQKPRIAGIAYLYLQALKPSSVYERYPPYFVDNLIVEQEDVIENFLKEDLSDEATDIRKILAHEKFYANRAMTRAWQPDSMSKLTNHMVEKYNFGR